VSNQTADFRAHYCSYRAPYQSTYGSTNGPANGPANGPSTTATQQTLKEVHYVGHHQLRNHATLIRRSGKQSPVMSIPDPRIENDLCGKSWNV
jgi:hypothetical protein